MRNIPKKETLAELDRELKMRASCYPRWINREKNPLHRDQANRQYTRLEMARDIIDEMTEAEWQTIIDRRKNRRTVIQTRLDV